MAIFFPVRSDISGLATDRRAGDCLCLPSRLSDPQTDIRDTSSPRVETMAGSSGSPHDFGSPSLFLDLPEDDDEAAIDLAQLETLEEMAYDLKTDLKRGAVADLRSQGILTGEDEIFSFKRCISRIHEMSSKAYQTQEHRPVDFAPFVVSEFSRASLG